MADDAGRLNDILAETSFLYGGNAGFVEDLHAKWATDPGAVDPSWRAFFSQLADRTEEIKAANAPPAWAPPAAPPARPEWLSAIDGMWPAIDAKLSAKIAAAAPAASPDEVRA